MKTALLLIMLCSSFNECINEGREASDRRAIAYALEGIANKTGLRAEEA